MKYTKGPWVIESGGLATGIFSLNGGQIVNMSTETSIKTLKANAQLIASAPDLLEALDLLLKRGSLKPLSSEEAEQVEQAISKAKGE